MPQADDIPWDGPLCPNCGRELRAEVLAGPSALTVAYSCPTHGAVALDADPFGDQPS